MLIGSLGDLEFMRLFRGQFRLDAGFSYDFVLGGLLMFEYFAGLYLLLLYGLLCPCLVALALMGRMNMPPMCDIGV